MLAGRLKGKPRKSSLKILTGKIPSKAVQANIVETKLHAYNRYGAFGLKLALNYVN